VDNVVAPARQVDRMWIKKDGVGITWKESPEISTGEGKWG